MSELELQSDGLEDDGAGYLISVSDLMSGLLFVFLITLVAFVINFRIATQTQETAAEAARVELDQATQARLQALEEKLRAEAERDAAREEKAKLETVRDDLTNARALREQMLEDIRTRLAKRGIRVEVDHEHGVLRLTENAISFPSGKAELTQTERDKLIDIGAVLMQVLPCYSAAQPADCDARTRGKLEAVFVEGHTDNVPLTGGRYRDNWELSAQRAMYTYRVLEETEPGLSTLANDLEQPLFSVSGYGDGRPVVEHTEPMPEPRNRRIDLRFIMAPPASSVDPEPVRALRERGIR